MYQNPSNRTNSLQCLHVELFMLFVVEKLSFRPKVFLTNSPFSPKFSASGLERLMFHAPEF